jgi:hypothetical protein
MVLVLVVALVSSGTARPRRSRPRLNEGAVAGCASQPGVNATWCRVADPTNVGLSGVGPAWTVVLSARAIPGAALPP